jgi:hypothetical protein
MFACLFVTRFVAIAALTLSTGSPPPAAHPKRVPAAQQRAVPRVSDLYSLRARRRFASYLRMRLLELREERLDRAADAIERRLPPDVLLQP